MWRRSLTSSLLRGRNGLAARASSPAVGRRWMSAALTPEEQEQLNEPREAMDYDVLLVRGLVL